MTSSADAVRASVHVRATPARVFEHFVDPERLVRWMGEFAVLDATPGGEFTVDIRGVPVRGRFLELSPPHRLVISWGHAGSERLPPGASTVTILLTPENDGTRVEVVHRGLPEPERSGHPRGWRHFLGRLAVTAAGGSLGPDTIMPPGRWTPPGRPGHDVARELVDDVVTAVRAAVLAGERDALRLLLHPYLHWTDANGRTTRGRTKVLSLLADGELLDAPSRCELRDGQVYRWESSAEAHPAAEG
jgi:uncharacterized protein YndB with AHSA1/START domain